MILSAIAAMARNRVIGKENKIPWHEPEDLKYFREKTKGKILIMGRKTFDSFQGKPLAGRFHIVITRQSNYSFNHPMVKIVTNIDEAIQYAKTLTPTFGDEVFVIGGAEIYKQTMPFLDKLYLTVINQDYAGDAYFPEIEMSHWKKETENSVDHLSFQTFIKSGIRPFFLL